MLPLNTIKYIIIIVVILPTIIHEIFEANSSFHVKWRTTEKIQFQSFFRERDKAMILWSLRFSRFFLIS